MSILQWMHAIGIRITAPRDNASAPRRFAPLGNGIDPEWRDGWTVDDCGFYETRRHGGQSEAYQDASIATTGAARSREESGPRNGEVRWHFSIGCQ
jgi:hypothetical protein